MPLQRPAPLILNYSHGRPCASSIVASPNRLKQRQAERTALENIFRDLIRLPFHSLAALIAAAGLIWEAIVAVIHAKDFYSWSLHATSTSKPTQSLRHIASPRCAHSSHSGALQRTLRACIVDYCVDMSEAFYVIALCCLAPLYSSSASSSSVVEGEEQVDEEEEEGEINKTGRERHWLNINYSKAGVSLTPSEARSPRSLFSANGGAIVLTDELLASFTSTVEVDRSLSLTEEDEERESEKDTVVDEVTQKVREHCAKAFDETMIWLYEDSPPNTLAQCDALLIVDEVIDAIVLPFSASASYTTKYRHSLGQDMKRFIVRRCQNEFNGRMNVKALRMWLLKNC